MGTKLYVASTMQLIRILWEYNQGNTLNLCNMLQMRAYKSDWSVGSGNILTIPDDSSVDRNLLTDYRCLAVDNIDAHFAIYKAQAGLQLHNSAHMAECLLASIYPETYEIVLVDQHLWKAQDMACGEKLFKLLMNKAIIDNKQTTRKLQDQWENYPAKMGDLDSNIDKFIFFYRNITMMLRARGRVIS